MFLIIHTDKYIHIREQEIYGEDLMDIKTFKKYCRNIHLGYWIAIIVFSLLALRSTFLYLRELYSGVPTGYFSYQNV